MSIPEPPNAASAGGQPGVPQPPAADPPYAGTAQQEYAAADAFASGQPASAPRGRTLSIVGLILAFIAPVIGLILSIIAFVQLRKSQGPRGLAIAGIVVGAVFTVVGLIVGIILINFFGNIMSVCAEYGPGVWEIGGVTYTCG